MRTARGTAPIIRWRWRTLSPGRILHAVEADPTVTEGAIVWVSACRGRDAETVVEPDGVERCLACFQALARG